MAIIASGSRYRRNTNFIIVVICLAVMGYCIYDGWIDKEFQQKHTQDGKPDGTLQFNRIYGPVLFSVAVLYFLISAFRLNAQKIIADEQGLHLSPKSVIAYNSIKKIDKRFFDKEGHFTIEYHSGTTDKRLKLSDKMYDNLGLLLDEVVRRTGAAPAETDKNDPEN